ncbi:hypothetical protein ST201phi2-1p138 [Pseudomonas phage 201phi2-1]|uniref:Uncharacterized protein n=1 Tax=Pseudomonas phage 201phi2-1 TaxID=198110 RepID=B3FJ01_BP201|nr:hypothetical protein ST201phi2-1p138 [Pseudomonas phage 201phi2-1]ABY62969.1 hypothetical protein 201phi2-1p138 [Pseudomonas phage 201phi2-1]
MKLEIQDAISSLVSPEQLAVTLDVVDTLLEQDYVLALDELNTVLMIADDYADSAMLVGRINDILTYALNYILNDRGVVVSDDASLGIRLAVVNTLLYIPRYIIPDDLAHIFQQNYDDVETMSQLVAFFSTYPVDELMEHIESASDDALAFIRKSIDERIQVMGEYSGGRIPVERIKVINKLLQTNGRERFSMMLELANAGIRVGRSYDELINISFEGLESRNPSEAASQMVGLAFFSDLPLQSIWSKLDTSLDEYTDNPMERKLMLDEFTDIKRKLGDVNENT